MTELKRHQYGLEKDVTFEAAHKLPKHRGMCSQLHGHSYRVTFRLATAQLVKPGEGDEFMVIDTQEIAGLWAEHCRPMVDHRYLNDVPGLEVPTTEVVARWIFDRMAPFMRGKLAQVVLAEGFTSRASWPE